MQCCVHMYTDVLQDLCILFGHETARTRICTIRILYGSRGGTLTAHVDAVQSWEYQLISRAGPYRVRR